LGGVLAPTLPELTMAELTPGLKGHDFVHLRQQLRFLAEDAALGKLSPAAYCEAAIAACHATANPVALEQKLLAAATLSQPLAKLISEIPNRYDRWLVVDYPQMWYWQLADRPQIDALFPNDHIIFADQLALLSLTPDIFYRLPQTAGHLMKECIIVDGDAGRAVQSHKHGLAAVFNVYLHQLKLGLALQEIWQTDADVMHPTASERVNF
jgi:hypothetical protein